MTIDTNNIALVTAANLIFPRDPYTREKQTGSELQK